MPLHNHWRVGGPTCFPSSPWYLTIPPLTPFWLSLSLRRAARNASAVNRSRSSMPRHVRTSQAACLSVLLYLSALLPSLHTHTPLASYGRSPPILQQPPRVSFSHVCRSHTMPHSQPPSVRCRFIQEKEYIDYRGGKADFIDIWQSNVTGHRYAHFRMREPCLDFVLDMSFETSVSKQIGLMEGKVRNRLKQGGDIRRAIPEENQFDPTGSLNGQVGPLVRADLQSNLTSSPVLPTVAVVSAPLQPSPSPSSVLSGSALAALSGFAELSSTGSPLHLPSSSLSSASNVALPIQPLQSQPSGTARSPVELAEADRVYEVRSAVSPRCAPGNRASWDGKRTAGDASLGM